MSGPSIAEIRFGPVYGQRQGKKDSMAAALSTGVTQIKVADSQFAITSTSLHSLITISTIDYIHRKQCYHICLLFLHRRDIFSTRTTFSGLYVDGLMTIITLLIYGQCPVREVDGCVA